MGELIKQTTSIGSWLDRIDKTRTTLIESAKSGNRVAAAFAMADARAELVESLADETIRAKLLRMTDPAVAMVELANNPSMEDRIRVCAIAILSGFTPGNEEFAIFGGGKNPGKLYTKERGFRILFAHLGIVPEVSTSHPEFTPFGTSGKKIWRVSGTASCQYNNDEYWVECIGDNALGIAGYETDNVAGVAAKARRRLLQALWVKVSPILTSEHSDDEDEVQAMVMQPAAITEQPVKTASEAPSFIDQIKQATTQRHLDATARAITEAKLPKDETGSLVSEVKNRRKELYEAEIEAATTVEQLIGLQDIIEKSKLSEQSKNWLTGCIKLAHERIEQKDEVAK